MTRALQRQIEAVKVAETQVNLLTAVNSDRVEAIEKAAADYDYLVLGETRDTRVKQRLFGNTSMMIAERTRTPVMLLHPETSGVEFGLRQAVNYVSGGYASVDPESRQRLEEHGFIENGAPPTNGKLKSSVSQPLILLIGALTLLAAFMMYAGAGGTLTWIGALLYLGTLIVFTIVAIRASKGTG